MWTSWKETNLGRRFFSCPNSRVSVSHLCFCKFINLMQCYIDCDVFLLQDNQYRFFLWCDPELCQRAKVVINNLTKENK